VSQYFAWRSVDACHWPALAKQVHWSGSEPAGQLRLRRYANRANWMRAARWRLRRAIVCALCSLARKLGRQLDSDN